MTYSEIKEMDDDLIKDQATEVRVAHVALRVLLGRKGFDRWWKNLGEDIQDDIFEEMKDEILKA